MAGRYQRECAGNTSAPAREGRPKAALPHGETALMAAARAQVEPSNCFAAGSDRTRRGISQGETALMWAAAKSMRRGFARWFRVGRTRTVTPSAGSCSHEVDASWHGGHSVATRRLRR